MEQLIYDYARKLLDERPFLRIELVENAETLILTPYYGGVKNSYKYDGIKVNPIALKNLIDKEFSRLNDIKNSCLRYKFEQVSENIWILFCAATVEEKVLELKQADLEILKTIVSYPKSVDELYADFRKYVDNRKESFISIFNYHIKDGISKYVTDYQLVIGSEEVLFGEIDCVLRGYAVSRNFIASLPRKEFEVYRIVNLSCSPEITGYYIKKKNY